MTTLQPRPAYSNEEIARLYPPQLELQQVQILLRHGERTPVSARFKNAGLPEYWPYCKAANQLQAVVLNADSSWDALAWKRRLETFGPNDAPSLSAGPKGEVDAICRTGELTDRGRETTLALGQRMRTLYVDQLGFMPSFLDSKTLSSVNLRSTPVPRALESVQQTFTGLYPRSARAAGLPVPTIVSRAMQDETLFPNEGGCKRFAELAQAFAARTSLLWNGSPELAYVNKKIGQWMPEDSPVIKVDSHPRLSGIMDTINATLAHGPATQLPAEFHDAKVVENIDRICVEEWFVGYQESNEYRKLGIGALVGDLTQRMVERATGSVGAEGENARLSLAGCHDTTLAATLTALGAFDTSKNKWPNYTSSIAFELFRRKSANGNQAPPSSSGTIWPSKEKTWWYSLFSSPASSSNARSPLAEMPSTAKVKLDDFYVRVRYNDSPVTLPYCKQEGKHLGGDESFCTLAAFKEAADSFAPKDWKVECRTNLGAPAMAAEIERPPGF